MLPDEPLLRPLENPPPDPPRAFAKEIVGTPTRDNTRHAAINLVVFKRYVLSIERQDQSGTRSYPNSNAGRKPSRPLRKTASGVLASLTDSTYRKGTPRLFALLRPCWTAFLNRLKGTSSE
jgi:hypothetical protein